MGTCMVHIPGGKETANEDVRELGKKLDYNFSEVEDAHLILTYYPWEEERTLEEVEVDVKKFIRRVKDARERREMEGLRHVFVIGIAEGEPFHVHAITNGGFTKKELGELWGLGCVIVKRLIPTIDGFVPLARYLCKEGNVRGELMREDVET